MTDPKGESEISYPHIRRIFDKLTAPRDAVGGLAYATEHLHPYDVRIGKSRDGHPALLLPTSGTPNTPGGDRHFANLRLRHGLRLRTGRSSEVSNFSVLECVSSDPAVRDWFLRLLPNLLEQLRRAPARDDVARQIEQVGELFRRLDTLGHRHLNGLWAELALIAISAEPELLVQAWHAEPTSTHDFTADGRHVEVKCTEAPERRHHFASSQLVPANAVIVVSLVLESADLGNSLMELYFTRARVPRRVAGSSTEGERASYRDGWTAALGSRGDAV